MSRSRSLRDYANDGFQRRRDASDAGGWRDGDSEEYAAPTGRAYDDDERGDTGERYVDDSQEYAVPYDETGYSEALPARGGALVPLGDESERLPALFEDETGPFVIPGTGESMGNPFIRRRERPLTMRIAVLTIVACILVTGLFAVTPLGSSADSGLSSFQALSGIVVWRQEAGFFWYIAQWNDTPESIALRFRVTEGGIYKLNGLLVGQELTVGKQYKIPTDPNYGAGYRPPSITASSGNGTTTFGNSPWTSFAGKPGSEAACGPKGDGTPTGYKLRAPNWGANWVRGFSWFHNGADIAAAAGNPIHAAQAGQVIWAGWDVGGFGYSVKINHCNGIATVYGHMMRLNVTVGQNVSADSVVGFEGSTGWSTGPHVHFMVEVNNQPVDPLPYYGYNIAAILNNG
ncbi:MAG: peptidoglycan DD-metalloendopeptidase family protein [Ktedonobacterales bacterium]|nr:peptidoglycan DD-metalloendopeptidase family protein [Ktedonobacterales bacterium]